MMMSLERQTFTDNSTIGELSINGLIACFTLEDTVRAVKVPGETAIPEGTYEVTITFSNRFQRPMPLLLRVPNFEGVRIHSGNTAAETEGCILVGRTRSVNFVGESRLAYERLFADIERYMQREKVFIEISSWRRRTHD